MVGRDTSFPQGLQRVGLWVVVAVTHIAVLYAGSRWTFSGEPPPAEVTPIQASLIAEKPVEPPSPSFTPPRMVSFHVAVTEPPVVRLPVEAPNAITVPVAEQRPTPPAARARTVDPVIVEEVAYIEAPRPRYPPESRRSREEGLVVLRVLVDEQGRAARIDVHQSSGHSRLDEAARVAVARALFKPYIEDGLPRPALVMVPIEFALRTHGARRHAG